MSQGILNNSVKLGKQAVGGQGAAVQWPDYQASSMQGSLESSCKENQGLLNTSRAELVVPAERPLLAASGCLLPWLRHPSATFLAI